MATFSLGLAGCTLPSSRGAPETDTSTTHGEDATLVESTAPSPDAPDSTTPIDMGFDSGVDTAACPDGYEYFEHPKSAPRIGEDAAVAAAEAGCYATCYEYGEDSGRCRRDDAPCCSELAITEFDIPHPVLLPLCGSCDRAPYVDHGVACCPVSAPCYGAPPARGYV